jgi:hypothetical protein
MHRVAGYNRRLRFSLTPKNFCCLYIIPFQPVKRKPYSYAVDEPATCACRLASGDKADAFVYGSQSLLGQLVGLGGTLGQQSIKFGRVAQ